MRFRCMRCTRFPRRFDFEADAPVCPKCGNVGCSPLVEVHFMVIDAKGPITGKFGRQHIACQPKREHLGLSKYDQFAVTGSPTAVTCRSCRGTRAWLEQAKMIPELAMQLTGFQIGPGGCCE